MHCCLQSHSNLKILTFYTTHWGLRIALSDDGNRALDIVSELAKPGPAGCRKHKNCDPAPGQILLIAEVGVGSDQQLVGRSHEVVIK